MPEPLVSICCLTYNHERFISDCLDGFLMQKVDFDFEILIHDDASTDNTAEIIKIYQTKYPEIIKPIYQKENQYSKGVSPTFKYNFPRSKGKYIAMCEGDDYWTDHFKLQKQVDFLENNDDYNLCVGGFKTYNVYTKESETIIKIPKGVLKNESGYSFNLEHTKRNWLTKTLTAVFRNDKKLFEKVLNYKYGRDIHLFYHLLKSSKGFYFTKEMGIYRIHEGGVNSMKQGKMNTIAGYKAYRELYKANKDEWTRFLSIKSTLHYFNFNLYEGSGENTCRSNANLYFQAVKLTRNFTDIRLLLTNLLSPSFKLKIRK